MVLTRELLESYAFLDKEIKRIRRRIKYYEDHPLQTEYGVVKGSMQQFPFAPCQFVVSGASPKSSEVRDKQIGQLLVELRSNEKKYADLKLDIECAIEAIQDLEMKQILSMKYIDGMNDGEIANELNYDRSTIGKKIDRYLDKVVA